MNLPPPRPLRFALSLLAAAIPLSLAAGQEPEPVHDERELVVDPVELVLDAGATAQIKAHVENAAGEVLEEEELMFFSRARRSVSVDSDGLVEAVLPGEFVVVVRTRRRAGEGEGQGGTGQAGRAELGERISFELPVTVRPLPIAELELVVPEPLWAGTRVQPSWILRDTRGVEQPDLDCELSCAPSDVAQLDGFGQLHLRAPGRLSLSARHGELETQREVEVRPNPVRSLSISTTAEEVRTGDVAHFEVVALNGDGAPVPEVPVEVSVAARTDEDHLAPAASGQVAPGRGPAGNTTDWRFVAETPGLYTLVATCGVTSARASVRVTQRSHASKWKPLGHGAVSETHTSDLWVWEGSDGRDYCVTGTWGADGEAIFWEVTDPTNLTRISSVKVDARTVNDVKVSKDGKLCVLSREGASNRKNGIVLVDVSDPRSPEILSSYDEGLTGGVHNVFVDLPHVYALSAGRRYDIIDVSDPSAPRTVGSYELTTPGHSIHDVWVVDGLAYSSNWADGVHIVDVGNGIRGGSPENPVYVGDYAYPSGWNHAAFPYKDPETGQFFVVAGDEAFPYGLNLKDKPTYARGWLHFVDFTDLENPQEVARYQVPEAGTHNFWIDEEEDVAYVGYYNGGLRAIDLSGELMGDLYRQGREIDFFLPDDPEGYVPNAPMVWGPMPHKGSVFFSDWNSGLWAMKLEPETKE